MKLLKINVMIKSDYGLYFEKNKKRPSKIWEGIRSCVVVN